MIHTCFFSINTDVKEYLVGDLWTSRLSGSKRSWDGEEGHEDGCNENLGTINYSWRITMITLKYSNSSRLADRLV